jgi:hypothetical protein
MSHTVIFDEDPVFDGFWYFDVERLIGRDESSLDQFAVFVVLIS